MKLIDSEKNYLPNVLSKPRDIERNVEIIIPRRKAAYK